LRPRNDKTFAARTKLVSAKYQMVQFLSMRYTMTLEFENTFDDLLAFNLHNHRASPTLRRPHQVARILYPILFTAALLGFYVYFGGPIASAVFMSMIGLAVVASSAWYLAYPALLRWRIRRLTTRLLRESKNTSLLERRSIVLSPDGLLFTAPSSSGQIGWNLIERVDHTPQFIFLYMSAMSAIVIPRRSVNSDAEWETVQQAINRYQQHNGDAQTPAR
jgi:YcxB-like protein